MLLTTGKILLIDDEPLVLEMFDAILTGRGYTVTCCSSAHEAVDAIDKDFFEIMICDVMLEPLNGFDLERVAHARFPDLQTFLITGAPNPVDAEKARSLRIHYLGKPLSIGTLIDLLEQRSQQNTDAIKDAA